MSKYEASALSIQIGVDEHERRFVWLQSEQYTGARVEITTLTEYDRCGGFTSDNTRTVNGTVQPVRMRGAFNSCKVRVDGLREGETYVWRVGCDSATSKDEYRFTVPRGLSSRQTFFIISDLHVNIYRRPLQGGESGARKEKERYDALFSRAASSDDAPAFFLSLGDNISVGNMPASFYPDPRECTKLRSAEYAFSEYLEFLSIPAVKQIPFASILGNHDAIEIYDGEDIGDVNNVLFDMPNDDGVSGHYLDSSSGDFYFQSGGLLVVGINAVASPRGNYTPCDKDTHLKFIKKAVNSYPDASWKILLNHVPAYSYVEGAAVGSNGKPTETAEMLKFFGELCDPFGFDIVFTGHEHAFSRTHPIMCGKPAGSESRTVERSDNGYKTERLSSPKGVVHYNVPSAMGYSFYSNMAEDSDKLYPAYGIAGASIAKAKAQGITALDDFSGIIYDSPAFVRVTLEEKNDRRTMSISAHRSDTGETFDRLIISKNK